MKASNLAMIISLILSFSYTRSVYAEGDIITPDEVAERIAKRDSEKQIYVLRDDQIWAVAKSMMESHPDDTRLKIVYSQFNKDPSRLNFETLKTILGDSEGIRIGAHGSVLIMPAAGDAAYKAAALSTPRQFPRMSYSGQGSDGGLKTKAYSITPDVDPWAIARASSNAKVQDFLKNNPGADRSNSTATDQLWKVMENERLVTKPEASLDLFGGNRKLLTADPNIQNLPALKGREIAKPEVKPPAPIPAVVTTPPGTIGPIDRLKDLGQKAFDAGKVLVGKAQDYRDGEIKKVNEFESNKFRCIHGGFVVAGSQKCNVSSMKESGIQLQDSKAKIGNQDVDLATLSCLGESRYQKVKAAKNKKAKKGLSETALCNPFKFGVRADGKAFCVQNGTNVSQACFNKHIDSKVDQEMLKKFIADIRSKNPEATAKMNNEEALVCSADAFRDDGKYQNGLYNNDYLKKDGQIEDVKKTCDVLVQENKFANIDIGPARFIKQPPQAIAGQPRKPAPLPSLVGAPLPLELQSGAPAASR